MTKFIKNLDFWGGTSSFLCAIHCAILPILISVGFLKTTTWLAHPLFEISMILLTIIFVYNSLIKGYFQGKVSKLTFYVAILGLIMVCIHHLLGGLGAVVIAIGGFTIAAAHFVNLFNRPT